MVSGRSSTGQGAEAYDARRAFDGFESGASAVAAAIFGIDHGYQGGKGIVTTGVLAMVPNEGIPWPAEAPPRV